MSNMLLRLRSYGYLLIWGLFIASCAYMIPYFSNDYRYMLIQGKDVLVTSFGDIAISQWNHYFFWGGRAVAHTIAQILLFIGKPWSAVISALCYLTLILCCVALACGTSLKEQLRSPNFVGIWIVTMALWLCLRIYGEVVFMLVSSCNYLFTTTIVLIFLIPYRLSFSKDIVRGWLFASGFFLLGILAGWSNENTGFAACLGVGICCLYALKNKKLRFWHISGALGLGAGYLLLMLSPGNEARLSSMEDGGFTFLGHLPAALKILGVTLLTQLPLILALIYCVYRLVKKKVQKSDLKNWYVLWWLFAIGAVSLVIMLASPNFPSRTTAPFTIFTAVFLTGLIFTAQKNEVRLLPHSLFLLFNFLLVMYTVFTFGNTLISYHQAMNDARSRDLEIASQLAEGKKDLVVQPFHVKTSKYLFIGDVRAQKSYFANGILAKFYKVHSIRRSCNYKFAWYPYDVMVFAENTQPVCSGDRGDPEDPGDPLNRQYLLKHPEEISKLSFKKNASFSERDFVENMKASGLSDVENYLKVKR